MWFQQLCHLLLFILHFKWMNSFQFRWFLLHYQELKKSSCDSVMCCLDSYKAHCHWHFSEKSDFKPYQRQFNVEKRTNEQEANEHKIVFVTMHKHIKQHVRCAFVWKIVLECVREKLSKQPIAEIDGRDYSARVGFE